MPLNIFYLFNSRSFPHHKKKEENFNWLALFNSNDFQQFEIHSKWFSKGENRVHGIWNVKSKSKITRLTMHHAPPFPFYILNSSVRPLVRPTFCCLQIIIIEIQQHLYLFSHSLSIVSWLHLECQRFSNKLIQPCANTIESKWKRRKKRK